MGGDTDGRNDLQEIIDKALEGNGRRGGGHLDPKGADLAKFARGTVPTRSRARTPEAKGLGAARHDGCGTGAETTVPAGCTDVIDALLFRGAANSPVYLDRPGDGGREGGPATARDLIRAHAGLVPP